jgi:hypothetical protein
MRIFYRAPVGCTAEKETENGQEERRRREEYGNTGSKYNKETLVHISFAGIGFPFPPLTSHCTGRLNSHTERRKTKR